MMVSSVAAIVRNAIIAHFVFPLIPSFSKLNARGFEFMESVRTPRPLACADGFRDFEVGR